MTVLEHIKHLVLSLTAKEKQELTGYLAEPEVAARKPESLRGDWTSAFADEAELEDDLKEIRREWQKEWRSGDFVG